MIKNAIFFVKYLNMKYKFECAKGDNMPLKQINFQNMHMCLKYNKINSNRPTIKRQKKI